MPNNFSISDIVSRIFINLPSKFTRQEDSKIYSLIQGLAAAFGLNTNLIDEIYRQTNVASASGDYLDDYIIDLMDFGRPLDNTDSEYLTKFYKLTDGTYNSTASGVQSVVLDYIPSGQIIALHKAGLRGAYADSQHFYDDRWHYGTYGLSPGEGYLGVVELTSEPSSATLEELCQILSAVKAAGVRIYLSWSGLPSPPENLNVSSAGGLISATWTTPSSGEVVDYYEYTVTSGIALESDTAPISGWSSTSDLLIDVDELFEGDATFWVRSVNDFGYSSSIKSVFGGNIIPDMTDYTTNGVTISVNTEYDTNFGWKMFDKDPATSWVTLDAGGVTGVRWAQVQFASAKTCTKVTFTPGATNYFTPQDFVIEASHDGVLWDTMLTVTGQTPETWVEGVARTWTWSNTTAYLYWRFRRTLGNYGNFEMAEMTLHEWY